MKKYLDKETIETIKTELEKIIPLTERQRLLEMKKKYNLGLFTIKEDQLNLFKWVKNDLEKKFDNTDIENTTDYLLKTTYKSLLESEFSFTGTKNNFVWNYITEKYKKELETIKNNNFRQFHFYLTETLKDYFITDFQVYNIFNDINYLDTLLPTDKKEIEVYENVCKILTKFLKDNDPKKLSYCILNDLYKDLNRFCNVMNS